MHKRLPQASWAGRFPGKGSCCTAPICMEMALNGPNGLQASDNMPGPAPPSFRPDRLRKTLPSTLDHRDPVREQWRVVAVQRPFWKSNEASSLAQRLPLRCGLCGVFTWGPCFMPSRQSPGMSDSFLAPRILHLEGTHMSGWRTTVPPPHIANTSMPKVPACQLQALG